MAGKINHEQGRTELTTETQNGRTWKKDGRQRLCNVLLQTIVVNSSVVGRFLRSSSEPPPSFSEHEPHEFSYQ